MLREGYYGNHTQMPWTVKVINCNKAPITSWDRGERCRVTSFHYTDVIMGTMASQITSLTIVYSTVYSDADHREHQCSASLAFVRGIHRGLVNSPHKVPVTRKVFPFDYIIMFLALLHPIAVSYLASLPLRKLTNISHESTKYWTTTKKGK